jgi:hypothetical protein
MVLHTTSYKSYSFNKAFVNVYSEWNIGKGKAKAVPVHIWTCPEGSGRWRLPDFKTVVTFRW